MRRHGHGPGFCDDTEVAAQSNKNNGADLRHAGAGSGAGYSSRAGYSNPFDLGSPTGFLEPLFEIPLNATSEVKPSLATDTEDDYLDINVFDAATNINVICKQPKCQEEVTK
jgi:hypothetical protein